MGFVIISHSLIYTDKMSLFGDLKERVLFSFCREEERGKIFLLEVSDPNLKLRAQRLSQRWVTNLRSSWLNLNSELKSTSLRQGAGSSPVCRSKPIVCAFQSLPKVTTPPTPLNLTHHLPALVTTKNMTLCLIPPSPGRSDPPLSNQMNLGVFPSFDHLVT